MLQEVILRGEHYLKLVGEGVSSALRLGREGQLIVGQGQGALYEAARQGRLFYAATAVAGVAPGTSIGTAPAFALANPKGSKKDLIIHQVSMGYVSGTLGAGFVAACFGPENMTDVVVGSGAAITELGGHGGGKGAAGKAWTSPTLPAAPTLLYPIFDLAPKLATSVVQPAPVTYDFRGGLVIPPQCSFSLQGVAGAGTTPLVVFGCLWEEAPKQ